MDVTRLRVCTSDGDHDALRFIKNLEHQIQEKDNVIRDLKVLVSNVNDRSCEPYNANDVTDLLEQNERLRAEIEKVKQHYKEMFESIKITPLALMKEILHLLTQIEDLKAQLEGNLKVATRSSVKTKVLAPGMYAIDVEPIPPRLKNNRNAHLTYINILGVSSSTRIWQPKGKLSDNSLNKTKQVWKATGKLFANVGYQWRPTGKKFTSGKLNCGYQWRPTGKKFALGELCPLTRLPVTCTHMSANPNRDPTQLGIRNSKPSKFDYFQMQVVQIILWYLDSGCSKLDLEEWMAPVRISSGPEPIMMTPGQLNSGLAPSPIPATTYIPPTDKDLEILFQPMFQKLGSILRW
ncbi:hypothetical protein Tco_1244416 [Tanacetum coccineum]